MLFQAKSEDATVVPWVRLFDAISNRELSEDDYFDLIRQLYNRRNPHAAIGEDILSGGGDED